jgi:hypothetical protein
LKSWHLDRRVDSLSEKLKPVSSDGIRNDFDSFTEPEKQLLRRILEIEEKYGSSPPADVVEANKEFIFKALEVVSWRVLELFMFVMSEVLGGDEIEGWFFKLHFCNFLADLNECLQRVRKWSLKDREEFLSHMKQDGMMNKFVRIPRGFNDRNTVKSKNERGGKADD